MCDPKAITTRYLDVLNGQLGWNAEEDDGAVMFGCVGVFDSLLPMFIDNHGPDDPEYLRMHTGIPLECFGIGLRSEESSELAARLTRKHKGAKIFIEGSFAVLSVEMLVAPPDCMPAAGHLVAVLPRVRQMLLAAVAAFHRDAALLGIEAATIAAEATRTDHE